MPHKEEVNSANDIVIKKRRP